MGEGWYWAAWIVWLPLFAHALWWAPWGRLKETELLNVWLGMIVLLTLLWSLKAGVRPGLNFHLLGATVFTLSFGPLLAFIGLSLVTLGITLNGDAGIFAYAANALLLAVYIFVNGFLGAALTIIGVGFAATLLLAMADAYEWDYLISEYFPYFLLLAFSEAWLSGMLMTLFVVYRPEWVVSFDDSIYLTGK